MCVLYTPHLYTSHADQHHIITTLQTSKQVDRPTQLDLSSHHSCNGVTSYQARCLYENLSSSDYIWHQSPMSCGSVLLFLLKKDQETWCLLVKFLNNLLIYLFGSSADVITQHGWWWKEEHHRSAFTTQVHCQSAKFNKDQMIKQC